MGTERSVHWRLDVVVVARGLWRLGQGGQSPFFADFTNYSERRATMGSTLVARRAGPRQAAMATRVRSNADERKMDGSGCCDVEQDAGHDAA